MTAEAWDTLKSELLALYYQPLGQADPNQPAPARTPPKPKEQPKKMNKMTPETTDIRPKFS